MMRKSMLAASAVALLASPAFAGNIVPPTTTPVTVSTVPSNGDVNPYGVAFVPQGFPMVEGGLVPGDILVSNFNNAQNLQGTGTTIMRIAADGTTSVFYQGLPSLGLSTGLQVLKEGYVFVCNFPTVDGTSATAQPGSLMILGPGGHVHEQIGLPMINGPWDMKLHDFGDHVSAFIASAIEGTVTRLDFALGQGPLGIDLTAFTVVASGYQHRGDPAALFVAPTGLAYDAASDTLYVASTDDNAVYAVHRAASREKAANKGALVYSDPMHLHGALAMQLAPNGHLLVTNSDVINSDPNQP
ncbi:MAG TPA: hypothetical protein VKS60_02245, partial [Stellaceae bacterium]|nr:hypothetical protein [Stellaceae bacterium]